MTTNKKLEEIPSITFDLAEVMQEWYKCECDCGKSTYFANKATKFFQKKLNSLFQEIEEKVIDGTEIWDRMLSDKEIELIYDLQIRKRKALKTIKERYTT